MKRERGRWFPWLLLSIILIDVGVLFLSGSADFNQLFQDLLNVGLSITGLVVAILYYLSLRPEFAYERKFAFFFILSFIGHVWGEVFWSYQELINESTMYISLADYGWYASYIFAFIAFIYYIKNVFIADKAKDVATFLSIATLISAFIAWKAYSVAQGLSIEEAISYYVLIVYPIMDVYVISLCSILIYPMIRNYNIYFKPFLCLAGAYVMFAVFDFYFAQFSVTESYVGGNVLDIWYAAAYALATLGLYYNYSFIKHKGSK